MMRQGIRLSHSARQACRKGTEGICRGRSKRTKKSPNVSHPILSYPKVHPTLTQIAKTQLSTYLKLHHFFISYHIDIQNATPTAPGIKGFIPFPFPQHPTHTSPSPSTNLYSDSSAPFSPSPFSLQSSSRSTAPPQQQSLSPLRA